MDKPVVLSIYYRHKQGGFTRRLYRAYRAIAAAEYTLLYLAASPLPVEHPNIQPVILTMWSKEGSWLYWPEFYWRAIRTMRTLSKQKNVRTHFVFSYFYAVISILASIGLPVKTLTFIRGDDVFDSAGKSWPKLRATIHQLLERVGVAYSERIFATSDSMRHTIATRTGADHKIASLSNDITTQALPIQLPKTGTTVKLATVSVINRRKNLQLTLQALAGLMHLDWEYRIIGPDTSGQQLQTELEQLTIKLGIAERVHFLGWQEHPDTYLSDCHLFVFPTLMEGSPNALLEAIGYGLPCLVSRIPEVTEVLRDPILHFDPHNSAELTTKLEKFMTDADYAANIATRTRADRSRYVFDWDQQIVSLIDQSHPVAAPCYP